MLFWESEHLSAIRTALDSARSARPSVLVVEGAPGAGKTSLLDFVAESAEGFTVLSTEGSDSEERAPFTTLSAWGVRTDGAPGTAFVVAQQLREKIDELEAVGPVLLRLDDLQWADPESVEALTWVLQRVAGDRLLVVVGTRPLGSHDHDAWQRFVAVSPLVQRIRLSGLSVETALELIASIHPSVPAATARYLWEHTAGNPLYLSSLLRDHEPDELGRMRVLPAPAEYARELQARVKALSPHAIVLLHAVAVLGSGWRSLADAATVAQLDDPAFAAEELVESQLVVERTTGSGPALRLAHALIRAAVYQYIPLTERRRLHSRAAEVVSHETSALEHRVAAADRYDDQLSAELEAFARVQHDDRSHRLAAQYFQLASSVTSSPVERGRLWLEGLFESVLADDLGPVRGSLDEVAHARDRARRALVIGAFHIAEGEWATAALVLAPVADLPDVDPLTQYRIDVLLAFARVGIGSDNEAIRSSLERAARLGVVDESIAGYRFFAAGQLAGRIGGADGFVESIVGLPARASSAPLDLTYHLGWRGALYALRGIVPQAIEDLTEVERRLQKGVPDMTDGVVHALLGWSHWLAGDWQIAEIKFGLAKDVSRATRTNPMLDTLSAVVPIGRGDFELADRKLQAATAYLRDMRWPEAIDTLFVSMVTRAHAGASPAARSSLIHEFRATYGEDAYESMNTSSHILLAHFAIASIWAGELTEAEDFVERMRDALQTPTWTPAVQQWLRGLIAFSRRDLVAARALLDDALALPLDEIPLYRAHLLVSHATTAAALGDAATASQSRRDAIATYRRIGATAFIDVLEAEVGTDAKELDFPRETVFSSLSDRERDVMALLASGMSYAQIARDLFITRSTVGFHLSNIYAKTGTTSRHELTDLVRSSHVDA